MVNYSRAALRLVLKGVFLWCCACLTPVMAQTVCSTDSNLAIPDGSGSTGAGADAEISINFPPTVGELVDSLTFELEIDHTFVGDLIVELTSPPPTATTVRLIERPGTTTFFGCGRNDIDVTLDDTAATAAEDQCLNPIPAVRGIRSPFDPLSGFDGVGVSGTWILTVTDNAGLDTGTIISAGNCLNVTTTTPVTISSFESKKKGKHLNAKWQTSSESFNLGFHLWGQIGSEWRQLNNALIASEVIDSVAPQGYKHRIDQNKFEGEITQIGVSSVSASGQEEFYGPFDIGEKYGEESVPKYVDWAHQRALHNDAMRNAGYVQVNKRWVRLSKKRHAKKLRRGKRFPDAMLEIDSAGMYRVSYEELLENGVDYDGVPVRALALTRGGVAVPREVLSTGKRGKRRFGPGAEIRFYGYGPSDSTARYVQFEPYRLSLDRSKVVKLNHNGHRREFRQLSGAPNQDTHQFTESFGNKNSYSFGVDGDGWFDSDIRAIRRIGTKLINVDVAADAILDDSVNIDLSLFGVTSFPRLDVDGDGDLEPNHHYRVYLNRSGFPEAIAEGYANGHELIVISQRVSGQLKHGDNEIEIELIPDNGHNIDLVYFIDGALSYSRPNEMTGGELSFNANETGDDIVLNSNGVEIDGVYVIDKDHSAMAMPFTSINGVAQVANRANPSQRGPVMMRFVATGGYAKPQQIYEAAEVNPGALDLTGIDYVVIADTSLIGESLQRFVDRQIELGRETKVVSSQSIFSAYSGGSAVPQAIADYLRDQSDSSGFQYVLLVGGHTYNYRGYNTDDTNRPITLIPSFYRGTESVVKQIPTAVPFVDFDNDGAPDRAIGRWPVRDVDQLKLIVDKTLAWHTQGSHRDSKSSLFIADANDGQNDFSQSARRVMSSLGLDLNPWQQSGEIILDDILADSTIDLGNKLGSARDSIVDGINQGPALTVFSGHGAPGVWGRQALINGDVSDRFQNVVSPTLMMPLACYTTYYETPDIKSLPEILLTDTAGGAVAITGPALLSRAGDNERFVRGLLEKMTVSGMDLGTAILDLKRDTHKSSPRFQTLVYNWVTLGDPTLSFGLPNTEPLPIADDQKRVSQD